MTPPPAASAYADPAAMPSSGDAPLDYDLSAELESDLVRIFKLLSDPNRLKILLSLSREGELHVTALCERLGQSQPAVSHHLSLLRTAGLIQPRRDGKHNYYSVCSGQFHDLMATLFQSISDDGTEFSFPSAD